MEHQKRMLGANNLNNMCHNQEQENESDEQGIDDYKIGGYHSVYIGEVLHKRYVIMQKLGWGQYSTLWLAKDFKTQTYVAVKVQKSAPRFLEAAFDEIEILHKVAVNTGNDEWI